MKYSNCMSDKYKFWEFTFPFENHMHYINVWSSSKLCRIWNLLTKYSIESTMPYKTECPRLKIVFTSIRSKFCLRCSLLPCVIVCINYTWVKYESGMYSLWFICVNSLKSEQEVIMKAQKSQTLYQEIISNYVYSW